MNMKEDLQPPRQLSTSRLLLRKPQLEDAAKIFERYAGDQEVVKFLNWQAHSNEDDTRRFLQYCLDEWKEQASFPYIIQEIEQASGPIGMIHPRPIGHCVSFGYVLARPYWGRGYTAEALKLLVDWFLDHPKIWRADAFCDVDNEASARVMQKAGMTFEGILRRHNIHPNVSSDPRDCRIFAKVR